MKNLKLVHKIILVNVAIAFVIAIYYKIMQGTGVPGDFALAFGVICLFGGIADLFLSLILFIGSSREWSKGFLFSAGILLLLSGISCGVGSTIY